MSYVQPSPVQRAVAGNHVRVASKSGCEGVDVWVRPLSDGGSVPIQWRHSVLSGSSGVVVEAPLVAHELAVEEMRQTPPR